MTDKSTQHDWVYLKLYPGSAGDRLDELITETVPAVLRCAEPEQWFFLRYVDDGGIHLRLRFRALPGREADSVEDVLTICSEGLDALASVAPRPYRQMIVPDIGPPPLTAIRHARVERDVYEPEVIAFGGHHGLLLAEDAFHSSSAVALQILQDERDGKYSRKTIAPLLMDAAVRSFAPPVTTAESFWRSYALFWLGGPGDSANRWLERFLESGRELRSRGVPVLASPNARPAESETTLACWRGALQKCASAYRKLALTDVNVGLLCGQFVHLMNNRLGVNVVEEAYLATLLGQLEGA